MIQKKDKSITTCFGIDFKILNDQITKAKGYLSQYFGSKFDHLVPHVTFSLTPLPKKNFVSLKKEFEQYLKREIKKPFPVKFSNLKLEANKNFFYLPVFGSQIKKIHRDIVKLFNQYREGCLREKDLERVKNGEYSAKEANHIKKYGYLRTMGHFHPHITIGDVNTEKPNMVKIKRELKKMLAGVVNQTLLVDNIHAVFYRDAKKQSAMKVIWEKDYWLGGKN